MRKSFLIIMGCLANLAGPALSASDASQLHDMNCLVMVTQSFNRVQQGSKLTVQQNKLQLMAFYFVGKIAARNPGKSAKTVIEENKAAVSGSIGKQNPDECAADITKATTGLGGAISAKN